MILTRSEGSDPSIALEEAIAKFLGILPGFPKPFAVDLPDINTRYFSVKQLPKLSKA
ncbi:hypothetical protein [Laspinema palackyanum]|uniref:hypothetical protein n=1 Tax=Laspinema palackyanum TaxID=3231601 RepID=UPI00345DB7BE|nr:hypothetical protein [Laspinema sp. D2c]